MALIHSGDDHHKITSLGTEHIAFAGDVKEGHDNQPVPLS